MASNAPLGAGSIAALRIGTATDAAVLISREEAAGQENGMGRSKAVAAAFLAAPVVGCALVAPLPPQVEVQRVELREVGPLDQVLAVALCVTNKDRTALDLRSVSVALDVAGAPLAEGASDAPVYLTPGGSALVPFTVATTTRNLGPQLLSVVRTGGLDYRLYGTVALDHPLAVPFSRSGQLDLLAAGGAALADAAAPAAASPCSGGTPPGP